MIYPKRYARMTDAALRRALSKRKLPTPLVDGIISAVQADRDAVRPLRKKREQHLRLWKQLIDPAVAELRNVQHMQRLTLLHPTPERTAALDAYAKMLGLLIDKLKLHVDKVKVDPALLDETLLTPSQMAGKPTKAFPHGKPNGGTYWVDWVPPDVVASINALFDKIPMTRGVKRKHPFPVVLDRATSAKRKAALLERTRKEMEHIERLMAAELADPRLTEHHYFKQQEIEAMRLQISRMQHAIHIITLLPPNAFIPPTWHGVMQPRTAPGEPPLPKAKTQGAD